MVVLVHCSDAAFDVLESLPSAAQCKAPPWFPPAGRRSCALRVGGIVNLDVQTNDGPTHETFCEWMTQQSLAEFWTPARPTNQPAFPIKDWKLDSTAAWRLHSKAVCPTEFEKPKHGYPLGVGIQAGRFLRAILFDPYENYSGLGRPRLT